MSIWNLINTNKSRNYPLGNSNPKRYAAGTHVANGRFMMITAAGSVSIKGKGAGGNNDFSTTGDYAGGSEVDFATISTGMLNGSFEEMTITGTGFIWAVDEEG